jgi:hypothetical protein
MEGVTLIKMPCKGERKKFWIEICILCLEALGRLSSISRPEVWGEVPNH